MKTFSRNPEVIAKLSPEQFRVTEQNGTEIPGTGEYLNNKEPGIYVDTVSGEPLFASSSQDTFLFGHFGKLITKITGSRTVRRETMRTPSMWPPPGSN